MGVADSLSLLVACKNTGEFIIIMAFAKKEGKSQSKNFRFTLALRVIIVSLALLIVPLIIHLMWMYRHDYTNRKKDLFLSLNILAESRSALINQIIASQIDFLELTNKNQVFYKPIRQNQTSPELNDFFKLAALELEAGEVFYIAKEDGAFKCIAASDSKLLDKSFIEYPFISDQVSQKFFVFFGVLPFVSEKRFIIGKTIYEDNNQPIGMLITTIPATVLAYKLAAIEDSPYVIDLSMITKDGIIFASSDPELTMRSVRPLSEAQIKEIERSGQIGDLRIITGEYELEAISGLNGAYQLIGKEKNFAVLSPVKNTKMNVILDVSEDRFFSLQQREYLIEIAVLLSTILIIGGLGSFLLVRRFSKPYNSLQSSIAKVAGGDFSARYQPDKLGFEINALGANFNYMIESVIAHEKKAKEESVAKELLAKELKIGYDIQMSMLPSEIPELGELDIATGFIPAKEVGGDFYDLFVLKDGKLVISIADTSGKGISACLYSLGIRSMLRSFCSITQNFHEIIKKANELFMKDTKDTGTFVTLWLGIYDPKTNILQYCNMGHNYPYLKRGDRLVTLKTEGMALGVILVEQVFVNEIKLEKNDQITLFTDGVIDVQNKKHEFFKESSLVKILQNTQGSAQDIIDSIMKEVNLFKEDTDYPDDLTIVSIKVISID